MTRMNTLQEALYMLDSSERFVEAINHNPNLVNDISYVTSRISMIRNHIASGEIDHSNRTSIEKKIDDLNKLLFDKWLINTKKERT